MAQFLARTLFRHFRLYARVFSCEQELTEGEVELLVGVGRVWGGGRGCALQLLWLLLLLLALVVMVMVLKSVMVLVLFRVHALRANSF